MPGQDKHAEMEAVLLAKQLRELEGKSQPLEMEPTKGVDPEQSTKQREALAKLVEAMDPFARVAWLESEVTRLRQGIIKLHTRANEISTVAVEPLAREGLVEMILLCNKLLNSD